MIQFKMQKPLIGKINLKRLVLLLFLVIIFLISSEGMVMAESQQSLQSAATVDDNSGSGTVKGVGLWILFTLAISYGLNNYLRKKENNPENTKS